LKALLRDPAALTVRSALRKGFRSRRIVDSKPLHLIGQLAVQVAIVVIADMPLCCRPERYRQRWFRRRRGLRIPGEFSIDIVIKRSAVSVAPSRVPRRHADLPTDIVFAF